MTAERDVLPSAVKPSHYHLALTSLDFQKWAYQGRVVINLEIFEPITCVIINTLHLNLHSAKLTVAVGEASSETYKVSKIEYDAQNQRASLHFADEISATSRSSLEINYEGIINNDMAGFYRSKYKSAGPIAASVPRDDDGQSYYMFSTQFEACDARRAYPCFDEPLLKATFDFEMEAPQELVVLSNMPVKTVTKTGQGLHNVVFERTPPMSTYLLAWALGDFEYVERLTQPRHGRQIPVRVYTTRGLKDQSTWAVDHAPRMINIFSESFGVEYPLPKADLLAVHEFSLGAMENWGLITYRATTLLFDDKTSDTATKLRIAYVVAHELAHHWFGNLVTMEWWDDLWLNESFATWAGWYAVNKLHPDWDVWAHFVGNGMESAFQLDSIRSSHPVYVPVQNALLNQSFDAISYYKGCSTLRMLVNHLGEGAFLKGISAYIKEHAYGNARTDFLWASLTDVSGHDIAALMSSWITKIGFPVVTIDETPDKGQITVRQSRFLSTGDVKPEEDETVWWLAIRIKTGTRDVRTVEMTAKEEIITDIEQDFYKINDHGYGFYRTEYPPARLAKLGSQLEKLSLEDKLMTIGSARDLASAGYGRTPTSALLAFLQEFRGETSQIAWSQVLNSLDSIRSIFGEDDAIKKGLDRFTANLISNAVENIGWEPATGDEEGIFTAMLRKQLLLTAVEVGHPKALKKASQLFEAWCNQGTAPSPSLRGAVYRAGIMSNPKRAFDVLKREWMETDSIDGKVMCLQSIGQITDVELIKDSCIPLVFGTTPDSIPTGDVHYLGEALAGNPHARPLQWEFMKNSWEAVVGKLANPVVLHRFVRTTLQKFTDARYVDEIDDFFRDKDTAAYDRILDQVKDASRGRAAYRYRDSEALRTWLANNGYLP